MKKTYFILTVLLTTLSTFAQAPEGFNYQALARDAAGDIIVNTTIAVQFDLRETIIAGAIIYTETHNPTTNGNGVFNLVVGQGTTTDIFNTIDWTSNSHFLEVSIDPANGTAYTSLGTMQLLSVPYALHAKTAESVTSICGLSIGDTYQGGIIFYLDASGCHGLIAAPGDQSTSAAWWNGSYMDTRAYGSGLFEGKYNTEMINLQQGGTTSAAAICANYGDGKWYLPSIEELNLMYINIGQGNALGLGNIGGFDNAYYWCSTEYTNGYAWLQNLGSGLQTNVGKFNTTFVRAVRAF
jgi:hypothetical protein